MANYQSSDHFSWKLNHLIWIPPIYSGVKKMLAQLAKDRKEPAIAKKIKEYVHEFDLNVERIYDLKAHHVRTIMTGKEREHRIAHLKRNQG